MGDTDVEVQASDSEVLPVLETSSHETLEDVVAVESECVGRVVDLIGLQVDLTAGAE